MQILSIPQKDTSLYFLPCRRRLSSLRCVVMSARNISFKSHFSSSSSGEGFPCTIKKTLISTRNLTNLKRILPQLNHLTLQCSSTSWYALSISLSKARNCLCAVAERATRKLSIFVTVSILGVSTPQFYSFLRRIASLFTLICLC